jgi:mRNA-degrading endonuclease RelE of RelBE toxin-antitoxin system
MNRSVEFTDSALRALAKMGKVQRKVVLSGIKTHLVENDPLETTRNNFPLRRLSPHAERELRLDNWRVFYAVLDDGLLVLVNLIGEKRGNKLFIEGEEFEL